MGWGNSWAGTRRQRFPRFSAQNPGFSPGGSGMLQHSLCQGTAVSASLLPPPPSWNDSFSILISLLLPPSPNPSFPLQCSRVFLFLLVLYSSVLKSWLVRNQWEFCCSLQRGIRAFSPHLFLLCLPFPSSPQASLCFDLFQITVAQYSQVTPASRMHKGNQV